MPLELRVTAHVYPSKHAGRHVRYCDADWKALGFVDIYRLPSRKLVDYEGAENIRIIEAKIDIGETFSESKPMFADLVSSGLKALEPISAAGFTRAFVVDVDTEKEWPICLPI